MSLIPHLTCNMHFSLVLYLIGLLSGCIIKLVIAIYVPLHYCKDCIYTTIVSCALLSYKQVIHTTFTHLKTAKSNC